MIETFRRSFAPDERAQVERLLAPKVARKPASEHRASGVL
jgi:hypothetical protein